VLGTALIGVLGALVGAVAAGFASYALQRRQEDQTVSKSVSLAREQFSDVLSDLEGVEADHCWRTRAATLASDTWYEHREALTSALSKDAAVTTYRAVAALERIASAPTPNGATLSGPLLGHVHDCLRDIANLRDTLDQKARQSRQWWRWPVAVPLLIVAAITIAPIVYLASQGSSLTASSLAHSLKEHEKGAELASCSHRPADGAVWDCVVTFRNAVTRPIAQSASGTQLLASTTTARAPTGSHRDRAQDLTLIADSASKCWIGVANDITRMKNQPRSPQPEPSLLKRLIEGTVSVIKGCLRS
jgi:hypothetical protein